MIETQLHCIACDLPVWSRVLEADLNHETPVTFCKGCNEALNTKSKRRKAIARWRKGE